MEISEIRKRINRVSLAILIFIGLISAIQVAQVYIIEIFYMFYGYDSVAVSVSSELITGFSYLISYIAALLIFRAAYKSDYLTVGFHPTLGSHPIAVISSALGIMFTASRLVSMFSSGNGVWLIDEYHGESIVLFVFTTALIPAFCEELFFRGLIMTNLMPLGKNFAIIASGVIFGLVHGNHDQILFAAIAGIVFGWIYAETGSIWCGVIIHMFNNLIAVAETVLIGTLPEETAIKVCTVIELCIVLCGAVSLIYLIPKMQKENKDRYAHGCFGRVESGLLDSGARFSVTEYMKGFFSPAMIALLCYIVLNEIAYVLMF